MHKGRRYCVATILAAAVTVTASLLSAVSVRAADYVGRETLWVDGLGHEVFSSRRLDPDRSYLATVVGVVPLTEAGGLFSSPSAMEADALYLTDGTANFTRRGEHLAFSTGAAVVEEDRAVHRYVFRLRGDGKRLSVMFAGDSSTYLSSAPDAKERFHVELVRSEPLGSWDEMLAGRLDWVRLARSGSGLLSSKAGRLGAAIVLLAVDFCWLKRKRSRARRARAVEALVRSMVDVPRTPTAPLVTVQEATRLINKLGARMENDGRLLRAMREYVLAQTRYEA